jgi:hypothetical protein
VKKQGPKKPDTEAILVALKRYSILLLVSRRINKTSPQFFGSTLIDSLPCSLYRDPRAGMISTSGTAYD